jgi:hypothetical protein
VIVFVVFDRLEQTFFIEALLRFKVGDDLLVEKIGPLDNFEGLITLGDCLWALKLNMRRTHIKALRFWLVQLVPGMLSNLSYRDSLEWVGDENLADHVFGFIREELWKGILSVKDLLV